MRNNAAARPRGGSGNAYRLKNAFLVRKRGDVVVDLQALDEANKAEHGLDFEGKMALSEHQGSRSSGPGRPSGSNTRLTFV